MFLGFFFFLSWGLFFWFIFFPHPVACGILVPWPEIEPRPSLGSENAGLLNHTTREFSWLGLILTMGIIEKWARSLSIPNEMCGKNGFQKMADNLEKMLYFGNNPKLINWLHIVCQVLLFICWSFLFVYFSVMD